jgi:hypothetical protein
MTRKQYCNIFLQTNLQFLSSIDVLYVDGTFKSAPKFSTHYLQFMDWATVTMWHLHFSYWPIYIKRHMRMCSDIRYQRLQHFVWMFVQQLFMLTSKPPFTAQWQQCGQAVKFRTELVAENTIFGAQQAVWKENLGGKSVLEEYIRTVAFTTSRSQRLLCDEFYIRSFERQATRNVLLLPSSKLYWCRLHLFSACLGRMFCTII